MAEKCGAFARRQRSNCLRRRRSSGDAEAPSQPPISRRHGLQLTKSFSSRLAASIAGSNIRGVCLVGRASRAKHRHASPSWLHSRESEMSKFFQLAVAALSLGGTAAASAQRLTEAQARATTAHW